MQKVITKLKKAKAEYKVTFKKVAKELNVSQNTVTNWVKGKHKITQENEKKLNVYLDKSK